MPQAYLKYIAYDSLGNYLSSDYQVLDNEADKNWKKLKLQYQATEPGYVDVFVANESDQEVFFDDMAVSTEAPLIVQDNSYDPWGMNLVGIHKIGEPDHKFQYNGKEKQDEFGLNWTDYGWRNYDPQLGRWHSPDPFAEKAVNLTPYRYGFNNPIRFYDPTGLWEQTVNGYRTDKKEDIERFMTYLDVEKNAFGNSPDIEQTNSFVAGEMEGGLGRLSDGSKLVSEVGVTSYKRGGGRSEWIADTRSAYRAWKEIDKDWNARIENKGLDNANKVVNYLGMNGDVKEGLGRVALGLGSSTEQFSGYMKMLRYAGYATGGASVGISIAKLINKPSVGAGFNVLVDGALFFAGPLGGIVGGLAEASGAKDAVADHIDYRVFISKFNNNANKKE